MLGQVLLYLMGHQLEALKYQLMPFPKLGSVYKRRLYSTMYTYLVLLHIAQTVIQSYYTMIEYGKKCIITVLTDLASWYFFKYKLTPKTRTSVLTPLVKIAWFKAHLLRDNQDGSDSRKEIVLFLAGLLKN